MRRNALLVGACTALLGGLVAAPPAAAAPAAHATIDVTRVSGTTCDTGTTEVRPSEDRSSVALQRWLTAGIGSPDTCTVEVEIRCATPTATVVVHSEFIGSITLAESTKATIDVVTDFNGVPAPAAQASFRGPVDWQEIESEHRSPAPAAVSCARPIRAKVTSTQSVTGSGEGHLSTRLHTIKVT